MGSDPIASIDVTAADLLAEFDARLPAAGACLQAHALAWVDREDSHACACPPGCESGL